MGSLTIAQALARRGAARLAKYPASTVSGSRALLFTASTSPSLRTSHPPAVSFSDAAGSRYSNCQPPTPSSAAQPAAAARRCFSQTALRPKKGGGGSGKGGKKSAVHSATSSTVHQKSERAVAGGDEEDEGSGGGGHPHPNPDDPFDFADVESRWQRTQQHHEDKLKELRRALGGGGGTGDGEGAVDVDAIGATPVAAKAGDAAEPAGGKKGHHGHSHQSPAAASSAAAAAQTVPLSQLALVLPRAGGRVVELRMHTPASKKAIVSAVQASPLFRGQQPQPDPDDELVLTVRLGGVHDSAQTLAEAAAERQRRVHDLANAWRSAVRRATARRQKQHQAWKKDGTVRPDDYHRLEKDLLKGQEKRMAAVDSAEKEALRQLERANRR